MPLQTDFYQGNHSNVGTACSNGHSSGRMLSAEAQYFCLQAVITCDGLKTVTLKELPHTRQRREATASLSDSTGNGGIMRKGISWETYSGFDERCRHKASTDTCLLLSHWHML